MSSNETQSVSKRRYNIAGIACTVYGLDELQCPASQEANVDVLWLLHRRKGDLTQMEPFATQVLNAWNRNEMAQRRGLVAVAFDHRNHGSRLLDEQRNLGWKQGNANHAVDLYSIYRGTAVDVSLLIDYLEAYFFPDDCDTRRIDTHMLLGASLGGHSAWHCALWEERIKDVVVVIGCPDYVGLMQNRATKSEIVPVDADIVGTRHFPLSLKQAVEKHDPVCRFVEGECSSGQVSACLDGKRIMCLSGGSDPLVPHVQGRRFRDWFEKQCNDPEGTLYDCKVQLRDVIDDGAGHVFTQKMADVAEHFVVECLEKRARYEDWIVDTAFGLTTRHI